jgi:hypothetical protein
MAGVPVGGAAAKFVAAVAGGSATGAKDARIGSGRAGSTCAFGAASRRLTISATHPPEPNAPPNTAQPSTTFNFRIFSSRFEPSSSTLTMIHDQRRNCKGNPPGFFAANRKNNRVKNTMAGGGRGPAAGRVLIPFF